MSAAAFLVVLLESLEAWAWLYQNDDTGKPSMLFKTYEALLSKGVKFPSQLRKDRPHSGDHQKDSGFVP